MGINKAKKVTVWCTEKPVPLGSWEFGYRNSHNRNRINKCGSSIKINKKDNKKYPPRITCPYCKKRFKILWKNCEGGFDLNENNYGCWHAYIPAHKKQVKIVRGKNKEKTTVINRK